MTDRHSIYCDDCGREKLAEVRDGKLVIADRRHGRRHVAVIPIEPLGLAVRDGPAPGFLPSQE